MTVRRQILAFSFFPAFVPPNNGGVERLYNLYSELSLYHDVTLISSSFMGGERDVVRHRSSFTEVRIPKDADFAEAYAQLSQSSGAGDISGPALGMSSAHLGALHDEYLEHYARADIIIHDSPFLINCDLFRGFDDKLRIYNSYNCETDLYAGFHAGGDERNAIAELVRSLEQDLCRHCDLITVCSEEDAATFRHHFEISAPLIVLPNGFTPGPRPTDVKREPASVVFMGSAHQPNVDAVRLIVDSIAPKLRDVTFHLIGSCHPAGQWRNVIAHGIVSQDKKEALLRSASAAINPMTSGGGSSLKIADIASNGCALLSTEMGVRGFGLEPETHYIAIDADDAVETIRQSLSDPKRCARSADRARVHFEQFYSWSEIVATFVSELESLASGRVPRHDAVLVLNDYDSLDSMGGGATRTRGLCQGLSESSVVIFLAFANDGEACRRVSDDGRILSLLVAKLPPQLAEHELHNSLHWISTADIVSYGHAAGNPRLMAMFRCAASCSKAIVCEHPYMVGLPRAFGVDFIYSSQNVEIDLKEEGLGTHPLKDQLLPLVREAEAFACAASSFIVAVSEGDAARLSAIYRTVAPILVVANGAEGPAPDGGPIAPPPADERPVAIFIGSVHGPNYEAARWIATSLAGSLPDVDFAFVGSIATSLPEPLPSNVLAIGEVDAAEKTRRLHSARVALNPMMSGSGSNVKMADYLQHGLPVLTTSFGARGYEWVPPADARVAQLDEFRSALTAMIKSETSSEAARVARQDTYAAKLSMDAGGRRLAALIDEHRGPRKRALYVTYRYADPARGGGEEYVVRLVHALAASGWEVDVVSPAADKIIDVSRFAAAFSGDTSQPVPTGHLRVRSFKFPLDAAGPSLEDVQRLWRYQPDFERQVAKALTPPTQSCLAWGWADPEANGRWCFRSAGIHLAKSGRLHLRAQGVAPVWLQIFSHDGRRLHAVEAPRDIDLDFELPAGAVALRISLQESVTIDDPRPLALFVTALDVDGRSLLGDRTSDLWTDANSARARMVALAAARGAVRDAHGLDLSPLRSPSAALERHVRGHVGDYDLLITHNAVFGGTTAAIEAAASANVPSILIPHLHYDDDFYHFRDVLAACRTASATLVSPLEVKQLLEEEGLDNVVYHAPGVDVSTAFTSDDVDAFRSALPGPVKPFFLLLGRKAAAKGYRDVIEAVGTLRPELAPMIVMIGPNDDGVPIDQPGVFYLGRQSDAVVRGALRECLGLINMSRSESFGMVLLQAGLAGKPVLANRNCAAFADLVDDGVNGYLTTREELPARMAEMLADQALRDRFGEEGRRRALAHDWDKAEQAFVRICNALMESAS